jgi:flagellar assembly factor FliW
MSTDLAVAEQITFAAGIPGFPEAHRFNIEAWGDDESPFLLLSCADDPNLAFVVVSPWPFYPDYAIDIDQTTVERLHLNSSDDALILAIVTIGEEPKDSTLNLLGPIVVNRKTGAALQVVLHDSGYDVRSPITGA